MTLMREEVERFKSFCNRYGVAVRDGKGQWQMFQYYYDRRWHIAYCSKHTPYISGIKEDLLTAYRDEGSLFDALAEFAMEHLTREQSEVLSNILKSHPMRGCHA